MIILESWAVIIPVALLLGVGLAMDVFAISISDGCKYPNLKKSTIILMAITFGLFQGLMPLIGWGVVYGLGQIKAIENVLKQIIPPLAFIILSFIGGKMIYEYVKSKDEEYDDKPNTSKSFVVIVILEAIATSIDALSSGLAMSDYKVAESIVSVVIISVMSFIFGFLGVFLGKKFGHKIGKKAELIGGIILIIVGAFILIRGEISANCIIPDNLKWLF